MMYVMRERMFRLGEDSDITDGAGQPVLHVDGKVLSLHNRLIVRDPAGRCDGLAGHPPERPLAGADVPPVKSPPKPPPEDTTAAVAACISAITFFTTGATGVSSVAVSIRRLACGRLALSGATTSSSRDGPARASTTAVRGSISPSPAAAALTRSSTSSRTAGCSTGCRVTGNPANHAT